MLESMRMLTGLWKEFVAHFYGRLLVRLPEFAPLFHRMDRDAQHNKLWSLLTLLSTAASVMDSPDWVDELLADHPAWLENLAWKHEGFDIAPQHVTAFAEELVNAMEYELGDRMTPEMRLAWRRSVGRIGLLMAHH